MVGIFTTQSEKETIDIGEKLGQKLIGGEVICLTGDLGGGKTHFTKGIAKGLGIAELILSPTFVVMRSYKRKKLPDFYHLDLYRMQTVDDLEGMDIEDIIRNPNTIVAIEWPERAKEIIPANAIWINFEYIGENERKIEITNKL